MGWRYQEFFSKASNSFMDNPMFIQCNVVIQTFSTSNHFRVAKFQKMKKSKFGHKQFQKSQIH